MEVLLIKSRNCHMNWKHTTKTLPLQSLVSEPPHNLPALLSSILPHSLSYGVTVLSINWWRNLIHHNMWGKNKHQLRLSFHKSRCIVTWSISPVFFFFLIVQQFFYLNKLWEQIRVSFFVYFSGILPEYVWIYYYMSEPVLSFLKFI